MTTEFSSDTLGDLLPVYYKRLFPFNMMYRWLSYGDAENFTHREFSFTLAGDIYIRFQSFNSEAEFEKELLRKVPEKIDIGAVYNQKPKKRDTSGAFQPQQKEFVLDIDLTDYDDVRTCCQGAKVCSKCWKYLAVAVDVLDVALREDFGFNDLLWVYSGRRGVHCWVCDEVARNLDVQGRSAVAEYLQVLRGGDSQAKKVKLSERIHPSIRRAVTIINENFESICKDDQGVFDSDKNLQILPAQLRQQATQAKLSDRWDIIFDSIQSSKGKVKSLKVLPQELALQFCYPRLDIHVSKGLNHLLKAPFCIHPKTGQVCVPFDPQKVHSFEPSQVPNVTQLVNEIGQFDKDNANSTNLKTWKKTKVAPYMTIFELFVKGMEKRNKGSPPKNQDDKMSF